MDSPTPTRVPTRDLLWLVPFSLYCWTAAFVLMVATSLVSVLAYRFRSPVDQSRWSARAFRRVVGLTRSEITVEHSPGFDATRPSVLCFNHVNVLDAHTACASIPQPFVGLMLAWHFKIPGYGWMMKATHGIPVHPGTAGRTDELVRHAKDRASKGLSILVFPEGHRTLTGKVGPYRRGMFFMARAAELPIVPVAVRGMFAVNRKGSLLIRPGKVTVRFGPQIEMAGLDDGAITALVEEVQRRVSDFVDGVDPDGRGMDALASFRPVATRALTNS